MITPFDAWAFAKLNAGDTLNGELDQIADVFKSMAVYLNGVPAKSRGPVWQAMMAARPDAAELIKAVADQDPTKPAPSSAEVIQPLRAKVTPASQTSLSDFCISHH